jgi:hypothetical protein
MGMLAGRYVFKQALGFIIVKSFKPTAKPWLSHANNSRILRQLDERATLPKV